jgi:isopenicillin-N N-acyltransferase-like protein
VRSGPGRTARAVASALLLSGLLVAIGHRAIAIFSRIEPPPIAATGPVVGRSSMVTRAGLREVFLRGAPEVIGADHARLLRDAMASDEAALWGEYERRVPWWLVRVGILDWGRMRFRRLDRGIPEARRRELAGEAAGFVPDPFASRMETYQRLLFLHSLYDVALPLEGSPLIGCTTFGLGPEATADGHALVARAFDFEAGDWFDRDKAVFLVREDGAIPFASVGWPGFVGVVTGMNAEGVVVIVHGGRAGEPSSEGVPVAFSLREVLERARDTDAAVAILRAQKVLVSHIVFVADARGHFAVVERAPGLPAFARETASSMALTNHFEGPLAPDPANVRVRATTTSIARRTRADELLAGIAPRSATPARALEMLRDHGCAGDPGCPLGDRRSIDAFIATHGIVADTTARVLWVSAGPHLSGRFVRLDLRELLSDGHDPASDPEPDTMPEDPIMTDGRWSPAHARPPAGEGR